MSQRYIFGVVENHELAVVVDPDSLESKVMLEQAMATINEQPHLVERTREIEGSTDPYFTAARKALESYGTGGTPTDFYLVMDIKEERKR